MVSNQWKWFYTKNDRQTYGKSSIDNTHIYRLPIEKQNTTAGKAFNETKNISETKCLANVTTYRRERVETREAGRERAGQLKVR